MYLERLTIENLRNIAKADILPGKTNNFIVGKNGAGKTTLLEAIYLLGRARSFRQGNDKNLIKTSTDRLTLFTKLYTNQGQRHKIGLSKDDKTTHIRRDRETVTKLSDLAKSFPLTVITPNVQRIIEEDPHQRRRLLNWGVFHVEHTYGNLAKKYQKCLNQRNIALRGSRSQLSVWDRQIAELGETIHKHQSSYLVEWNKILNEMIEAVGIISPLRLELKSGWKRGLSLQEAIEANQKADIERGFTTSGPHRTDIRIMDEGADIKSHYSRGQKKIAVILLLLGQAMMQVKRTLESPILLIDEIHSELDSNSYHSLLAYITELQLQSFITTLEPLEKGETTGKGGAKMFHVEHGTVSAF
ncbi:MAG: DNA replication and repair protein RecF [Candidatus Thiodiazotropha sp. (ex Dulcina madagascariensis)]|nr:DNA replication and repair protein RecF [Candidatus Thiodiazotropha sp. (ex Dulcina madagascariensis)]